MIVNIIIIIFDNKKKKNMEPEMLKGYTFLRKLGEGGQGAVYLAIRDSDGIEVAIKEMFLKPGMSVNSALREINFLKELSKSPDCNPYMSCYYDHEIFNRKDASGFIVYLVMEYIKGPDLEKYSDMLRRSDPKLLVDAAFKTLTSMLLALNDVHSKGIIHNDVKPKNIVVEEETSVPKLVDFGLSCKASPADSKRCVIVGGRKLEDCCTYGGFTYLYVAPERIINDIRYPKSDVWSLGATIYNMITGKNIFGILNMVHNAKTADRMIREMEPAQLNSGNKQLDKIVNLMTIKDPAKRISTQEALAMIPPEKLA
jgi:serine/threonine protein kinase